MRTSLVILAACLALLPGPALAAISTGSASSSSSLSSSRSTFSTPSFGGSGSVRTYGGGSPPPPGTRVVVTQSTGSSPAKTATVPPRQTVAAATTTSRPVTGTPYSPSGYTDARGRPTTYSPVTRTYVEVHYYPYSTWGVFGWHPFYGYYGCLYCWGGPDAYAPVPLAPTRWTQPPWAFDLEAVLLLFLLVGLLLWAGAWIGRRRQ